MVDNSNDKEVIDQKFDFLGSEIVMSFYDYLVLNSSWVKVWGTDR